MTVFICFAPHQKPALVSSSLTVHLYVYSASYFVSLSSFVFFTSNSLVCSAFSRYSIRLHKPVGFIQARSLHNSAATCSVQLSWKLTYITFTLYVLHLSCFAVSPSASASKVFRAFKTWQDEGCFCLATFPFLPFPVCLFFSAPNGCGLNTLHIFNMEQLKKCCKFSWNQVSKLM